MAELQQEWAGNLNAPGGSGESITIGGIEVIMRAPDGAVAVKVFCPEQAVVEARNGDAYSAVQDPGGVQGVQERRTTS